MDNRTRGLLELWGIRLLLLALVLAFAWSLLVFPVWSSDGRSMLYLLGHIRAPPPVDFVLARLGPAGAIVWLIGAVLIENGRLDRRTADGRRWSREDLAVLAAVGAVGLFVLSFGPLWDLLGSWQVWDIVRTATGLIVLIAVGLYLLWTAERVAGSWIRRPAGIALTAALVAWTLNLFTSSSFHLFRVAVWDAFPALSMASSLVATGSLGVWILIFSLIVSRGPVSTRPVALDQGPENSSGSPSDLDEGRLSGEDRMGSPAAAPLTLP